MKSFFEMLNSISGSLNSSAIISSAEAFEISLLDNDKDFFHTNSYETHHEFSVPAPEPIPHIQPDTALVPDPIPHFQPDTALAPEPIPHFQPDTALVPDPIPHIQPDTALLPDPIPHIQPPENPSYEDFTEFLTNQVNSILPDLYSTVKDAMYAELGNDMYDGYEQNFTNHVLQNYEHVYDEIKADFYGVEIGLPPMEGRTCGVTDDLNIFDILEVSSDDSLALLLPAIEESVDTFKPEATLGKETTDEPRDIGHDTYQADAGWAPEIETGGLF